MSEYKYYEYIVEFWDELEDKTKTCCGIVCAASYSKAVKNIRKHYGDENILKMAIANSVEDLSVYDFEDSGVLFKTMAEAVKDG